MNKQQTFVSPDVNRKWKQITTYVHYNDKEYSYERHILAV